MEYLPASRKNARHHVWGTACDGCRLVNSRRLSVIEECMPPGPSESRHYRGKSLQLFYILRGRAVFECGSARTPLFSRQGLLVPPRLRHQL